MPRWTLEIPPYDADSRANWRMSRETIEASLLNHGGGSALRNRIWRLGADAFSAAVRGCGLWARGRRNARRIERNEVDVVVTGLPTAFDGFTILQLSDIHAEISDRHLHARLARALHGIRADLGLLTGDFTPDSGDPSPLHILADALTNSTIELGWLATLGNHDRAELVDAAEAVGIRVLINETATVRRNADVMYLTGIDDVRTFGTAAGITALRSAPSDGFRIVIVHSAHCASMASALGFGLLLSGHTHGGQVCLPGGIPVLCDGVPRRLSKGLWRLGSMQGYTSRGIGTTMAPLRFNCPPEITLIRLRAR